VLAGPDVLGLVHSEDAIALLSQIAIAVLLFLVGLKLDLNLVRNLGAVAVATGLGQVTFTAVFGFLICLALGIDWLTSIYIAVALTFSSTIIIVKLLSDKREITALHGKIALGFLIVQDIFVVLAMVTLSALGVGMGGEGGALLDVALVFLGGLAMLAFVIAFATWIATPLMAYLIALAGAARDLRRRLGGGAGRASGTSSASARSSAGCSPASRSPPRPSATPSARASRPCATSSCSSSSSRSVRA
jgi:Kef-type K+ transport system membrane component KefB